MDGAFLRQIFLALFALVATHGVPGGAHLVQKAVAIDPASFPEKLQADVAQVAPILQQFPNDACVLYQVALLHTRAGHIQEALATLRAMVATGAGLHPRERDGFGKLAAEPEYQELIARLKRENPPVIQAKQVFELAEGDLVPEGIAYSATTKKLYLGSIKRKVLETTLSGKARDFVPPAIAGLNTLVGLRVDDKRGELWGISEAFGPPKPADAVIGVFRFRLRDGSLIKAYPIQNENSNLLNDLTVAPNGQVYITATNSGTVLRLDPVSGKVERFAAELPDPNGITVTPDGKYLFVAGWYSITRIDLATGAKLTLRKPDSIADGCFDGLYWAGNNQLVGLQNCVHETGRVMRLQLSSNLQAIEKAEVLESYNPKFNGITTAAIAGNYLYFIANTQFRKLGPDGKPNARFDPLVMLKLKLR